MNPFRTKYMRELYDAAIHAHQIQHKDLFLSDGCRRRSPNYGSSFASYFWHGYDGVNADKWDRSSRTWAAYAFWCAGRDVRRRGG